MKMKNTILIVALLCIILSGCAYAENGFAAIQDSTSSTSVISMDGERSQLSDTISVLPKPLVNSYYLEPDDPVVRYVQNNSIKKFWGMWVDEYFSGEDVQVT